FSWVKGSFLVALRREFVQFIHTDKRALEILDAMKAESHIRKVQDELFFSTLAYNPHLGAPGACSKLHPITYQDPRSWFLARYVNWDEEHCPSKLAVHWLCILGMRDLPILVRQPHLFANKFLPHFEPEAYTCMEYWYWKKVHNERIRHVLDPSFNKTDPEVTHIDDDTETSSNFSTLPASAHSLSMSCYSKDFLYLYGDLPGSNEISAISYARGVFGAPTANQGSFPGVAVGTVAAPLEKTECVSEPLSLAPAITQCSPE
ncbi:uncharacterized protein DEA37_0003048, partial [Paragonimus westermani]